jgi:hypothetical protein
MSYTYTFISTDVVARSVRSGMIWLIYVFRIDHYIFYHPSFACEHTDVLCTLFAAYIYAPGIRRPLVWMPATYVWKNDFNTKKERRIILVDFIRNKRKVASVGATENIGILIICFMHIHTNNDMILLMLCCGIRIAIKYGYNINE